MKTISLVINTLNEETEIADCINSVGAFADEIIVCDMYSTDRTVEVAKRLNATIVYHERTGYVEPARHYAISQATCEWILVLDADERMTKELRAKLKKIVEEDKYYLVTFCWLFEYFGDYLKDGTFYKNRVPRFFRQRVYLENYSKREEKIHQNFRVIGKTINNKIELPPDFYLIHNAYPTIEKYVTKTLGKYARIEAEEMIKFGVSYSFWKMILDPLKSFLRNYFRNGGYQCGVRGFIKHYLYSVYRFNVWANVWFYEQNGN